MIKHILGLLVLVFATSAFAQKFTLSGYIRDADTGENLIGATIIDPATFQGTISNTFGFYSITLPTGEYVLRFTFVGYQAQEMAISLNENQSLNVSLNAGTTLEAVVVTAEENIELSPRMSTIDVPIEQIKALPVLMGETDLLKSLQLLPGIQGGTEGASGIYVRGGGPDQNLILLDGVPVYNVSHLFGFFSVFNPDAINRVSVVKGGFPARYGGRLSSVIDISMKEGNNQKLHGEGAIGLISSKLTLEGPLGKDKKTTFLVSGRRTYIDLLTRPIIRASSGGDASGGYFFYDFNAKVNRVLSEKDRIYLSFYNGKDKGFAKDKYDWRSDGNTYEEVSQFGLQWGNTITALRWNHVFNPKLFANVTGTYSKYKFRIFSEYESNNRIDGEIEKESESIEYFSGIDDLGIKVDFDFLPNPNHSIKYGINATHHQFNPGILGYETNVEGQSDTTVGANKTYAMEFSTYVEDDIQLSNNLRANVGLHYSNFIVNNSYYDGLQPRVSMRYLIDNSFSIKGSFATMTQYIHLLTNGGLGLPTDLWVPATENIGPQRSWQAAIGAARTFKGLEASVEMYYKEMTGLIEYKEGSSYFNLGSDWQEKVTTGTGDSYGLEVLLQKKTGKLSGWVGYTLSWTNRQFDEVNFGKEFPYKYDRRHDISVVAVYDVSPRFSISSTWVYGTGSALTLPISEYQDNSGSYYYGKTVIQYSDRNDFRMRDYHRMDLGLTWTRPKGKYDRSWSLGAYNVYNRRNPFFMDQSFDNRGNKKFVQYSLFPLIPYVRYSFKF